MILSMIKHNYSFIILVRSIAFCVGIRTPYHNTIAIKGVLKIRRQKSFIFFSAFSHCIDLFRLHGNIPTITNKQVNIHNPLLSTCKQGLVFVLQII